MGAAYMRFVVKRTPPPSKLGMVSPQVNDGLDAVITATMASASWRRILSPCHLTKMCGILTRTTHSGASTKVGERLIETLRTALDDIDERLAALSVLR